MRAAGAALQRATDPHHLTPGRRHAWRATGRDAMNSQPSQPVILGAAVEVVRSLSRIRTARGDKGQMADGQDFPERSSVFNAVSDAGTSLRSMRFRMRLRMTFLRNVLG